MNNLIATLVESIAGFETPFLDSLRLRTPTARPRFARSALVALLLIAIASLCIAMQHAADSSHASERAIYELDLVSNQALSTQIGRLLIATGAAIMHWSHHPGGIARCKTLSGVIGMIVSGIGWLMAT